MTFVRAPWQQPAAVYRSCTTPPAVEPFTVDEALLRCGFVWAVDDPRRPLVTDWIKAARQQVEHDTGLALLTQSWQLQIAATADGVVPLPPQALPLQSITDVDGNPVPFALQGGALLLSGLTPTVVDIVSGWPDVDALRLEAPLLLQAVGLLVAHYATVGRDLAIVGTIVAVTPLGYDEAIQPYRAVQIP